MRRDVTMPLVAAGGCVFMLGLLAYAAYSFGPIEHLDLRIFLHFQSPSGPGPFPATLLVHLGDLVPLLAFMAIIASLGLCFQRRRQALGALAVVVGANLTTQVLKILLEHSRHAEPGAQLPHYVVSRLPNADAFPSGHTTAVAAVAVALLFVVPRRHTMRAASVGVLLTASVAFSVVALGWHYPSDALGAVLVAGCWGFLMLGALRAADRPGGPPRREESTVVRGRLVASGD